MVCGILGVSLSWLLTGSGEGPTEPHDETEMPQDVSDLLTELRTLRTQMKGNVEKLAQLEKRLRSAIKDQT